MVGDQTTKDIGLRGIEVADTNICLIKGEEGRLYYRGYDINDLAKSSSFEEVVYLLIYGNLPTNDRLREFSSTLTSNRAIPQEIIDNIQRTPKTTSPMCVLQSNLALLSNFDPELTEESKDANRRKAIRIIAKLPSIVAAWERTRNNQAPVAPKKALSHAANFLYMLKGKEPTHELAKCFDLVLLLHAEHSFNASTFTARVIASTGATIYSSISGAIGSLSGVLHGGANPYVMKNLLEIGEVENVEDWVKTQFDQGKRIMGMGHAIYKTMDPRAIILKQMAERLIKEKPDSAAKYFNITNKMVEVTQEEFMKRKGRLIYPNVDLYSASVYSAIGIPVEAFTPIFTVSRVAGWAAHVLEEKFPETPEIKPVIYRPSADYIGRYCGPLGCEYIPVEKRKTQSSDMDLTKRLINEELQKNQDLFIPVALSARHIHMNSKDFHKLFGINHELHPLHSLTQPKEFACEETVDLIGPNRALYGVRIVGPLREHTQVEISRSDGHVLGINPPVRQSGDISGTLGIHIMGPKGAIKIEEGVICVGRHIHMNPEDANKFGVSDKQMVAVSFPGTRAGVLDEVMVRVDPDFALELHLDLDEGNALFLKDGDMGHLISDFDHKTFSPFW